MCIIITQLSELVCRPLIYKALPDLAPHYLTDFCQPVSLVSGRSGLRSSRLNSSMSQLHQTSNNDLLLCPLQQHGTSQTFNHWGRSKTHLFSHINCHWYNMHHSTRNRLFIIITTIIIIIVFTFSKEFKVMFCLGLFISWSVCLSVCLTSGLFKSYVQIFIIKFLKDVRNSQRFWKWYGSINFLFTLLNTAK